MRTLERKKESEEEREKRENKFLLIAEMSTLLLRIFLSHCEDELASISMDFVSDIASRLSSSCM